MANYHKLLQALQPYTGEIEVEYDEPMSRHTTMRVGGPADVFFRPRTDAALVAIIEQTRYLDTPLYLIGNGSNLIVKDEGIRGVVVSTTLLRTIQVQGHQIVADAGATLSQIANTAAAAGLTGFEFAAGIPGTLGGAVFMNAGAYGGQMADYVTQTTYFSMDGTISTLRAGEHQFGYRTSFFKRKPESAILRAEISLQLGDPAEIMAQMQALSQRRREKQPLDLPSAGSTFKRPEGQFAGQLIEQAGLKGYGIGGAQVSEKHAGFIVNQGGATCTDILQLIAYVQARVKETSGIQLECEVRIL